MATLYGAEVNWTPEFSYIIKPIGAFMIALSVAAAAAAVNPLKHRVIIYSFVTLFLLRAIQRLVFAEEIEEIFAIGNTRNLANVAFFLALGGTLIILDTLTRREPTAAEPGGSTASPVQT
jgi:hypothetical protein